MPSKKLNNKHLICITGLDGAGKSTLIKAVAAHLPDCYIANIWDLLRSPINSIPFKDKRQVDHFLCDLTPNSRLLFLTHALQYSIDMAIKSEAKTILVNSYYYKYFATELALGADLNLVSDLINHFPQPDLVIKLDLEIELAVKRKEVLSRYECGLAETPSSPDFVKHQKLVEQQWKQFSQDGWECLDARLSPERLCILTSDLLEVISTG